MQQNDTGRSKESDKQRDTGSSGNRRRDFHPTILPGTEYLGPGYGTAAGQLRNINTFGAGRRDTGSSSRIELACLWVRSFSTAK